MTEGHHSCSPNRVCVLKRQVRLLLSSGESKSNLMGFRSPTGSHKQGLFCINLLLERLQAAEALASWMGGKHNIAEELLEILERADTACLAYETSVVLICPRFLYQT